MTKPFLIAVSLVLLAGCAREPIAYWNRPSVAEIQRSNEAARLLDEGQEVEGRGVLDQLARGSGNPSLLIRAGHAWRDVDPAIAASLYGEAFGKRSSVRRDAAFWLARTIKNDEPERAVELLFFAERAGRDGASKELATLLDRHRPDDPRIEGLWRNAAQTPDPWAIVTVAQRWNDATDIDKAIVIFRTLHNDGHPRVSIDLARLYAPTGLRPDAAQHRRWLEEAAPRSALGSLMLGQHLLDTASLLDTAQDRDQAAIGVRWIERAIEQGSSGAATVLGRLLLYGNQLVDAQPERAAALLASAAGQDNTTAMHAYASVLFNGIGTHADPARGATWLIRAAESGHQWAQAELGQRLVDGDLVAQDLTDGRRWLARAADQGNQQAIEKLQALDKWTALIQPN